MIELLDRMPDVRIISDEDEETDSSPATGDAEREQRLFHLPPKRKQVLLLLLDGLAEKQVAARLGVSEQTVHWHLKRIYTQLGVHSRAELAAFWRRLDDPRDAAG